MGDDRTTVFQPVRTISSGEVRAPLIMGRMPMRRKDSACSGTLLFKHPDLSELIVAVVQQLVGGDP